MRYDTIREFMSLKADCEFCSQPLSTRIISRNVPNHLPSFIMDFNDSKFFNGFELVANQMIKDMKDIPQISYHSAIDGDEIGFFYKFKDTVRMIYSVNVDTNKISNITVDRMQRIVWDHKPLIIRNCNTKSCQDIKQGYACESTALHLERKSNRFLPTSLDIEVLSIGFRDKTYMLSSSKSLNGTFLVCKSEVIKKLPFMPLYPIKGADNITNKIKTIITFS